MTIGVVVVEFISLLWNLRRRGDIRFKFVESSSSSWNPSSSSPWNPLRISVECAWVSWNVLRRLGIRLDGIEPVSPSLNLLYCHRILPLSCLALGEEN